LDLVPKILYEQKEYEYGKRSYYANMIQ